MGNEEFGTLPNNQQNNQEEVIIFSAGEVEQGDDGSYF